MSLEFLFATCLEANNHPNIPNKKDHQNMVVFFVFTYLIGSITLFFNLILTFATLYACKDSTLPGSVFYFS